MKRKALNWDVFVVILSEAKNPAISTNFEVNLAWQSQALSQPNDDRNLVEVAGCFAPLNMTEEH